MGQYDSLLWGGPCAGLQPWAEALAPRLRSEAPTRLIIDWETGDPTRLDAWISQRRRDGSSWPGADLQQLDLTADLQIPAQQLPELFLSVCLALPLDAVLAAAHAEALSEDPACAPNLHTQAGRPHLRVGQFYLQFLSSERFYLVSLSAVATPMSHLMSDSPSFQQFGIDLQTRAGANFCLLESASGCYTPLQQREHWLQIADLEWRPETLDHNMEKLLAALPPTSP